MTPAADRVQYLVTDDGAFKIPWKRTNTAGAFNLFPSATDSPENLNLETIATLLAPMGAEYNTKNFPAIFTYLSEGTERLREYISQKSIYDTQFISQETAKSLHRITVALLFAHCTTVITGATCEDHALRTAHEFCRNVARLTGIPVSVNDFRITNMVLTFDMWPIDIARLAHDNPAIAGRVTFRPHKFPMAFVQSEPGSGESKTALVSYCGPVIVTGVKSPEEGLDYLRSLLPYLKEAEEKVAPITSQEMCVKMIEYKRERALASGGMWDDIGSRNELHSLEKSTSAFGAMQHVASTWIIEDALEKMKASGRLPPLPSS